MSSSKHGITKKKHCVARTEGQKWHSGFPRRFWENNNLCICIVEHVTHFRPLTVFLHVNERLRAIYCISKSHIRQRWLFADIILKTRSRFLTSPFFSLISVGGDTRCVVHWKHFAHINWPVAQSNWWCFTAMRFSLRLHHFNSLVGWLVSLLVCWLVD